MSYIGQVIVGVQVGWAASIVDIIHGINGAAIAPSKSFIYADMLMYQWNGLNLYANEVDDFLNRLWDVIEADEDENMFMIGLDETGDLFMTTGPWGMYVSMGGLSARSDAKQLFPL